MLLALAMPRPHATLVSSEPAANAVLAASPARLRLVFSEPVEIKLSSLVLTRGAAETRLTVEGDPRDVHALVARVQSLPAGAYRVVWRVVSADGHPVSGAYGFRIGTATPAEEPVTASIAAEDTLATANAAVGPALWRAPVIPAALRGLALAALLALAGLLALGEWVLPNAGGGVARATPWLAGTALVLLSLHAGAWIANVSTTPGMSTSSGIDVLRSSGSGQRELVRLACALLALWALALARRRGIAACFALAAVAVSGVVGHPSAIHPALAIPAKILHLLGGAVWLGGLLWIVLADRTHPRYTDGARRISTLALVAVLVVASTGVAQMLLFLPTPAAALHSPYGALSFAKIAGLLVLVGFGAYHRYALLPRLIPAEPAGGVALGRSVRGEIGVMLLVILIGGLLAYVPP